MKQLVVAFAILLIFGCQNPVQETVQTPPRVRAVLKANGNSSVKATVVVEGRDGNALSGAVVTVRQ